MTPAIPLAILGILYLFRKKKKGTGTGSDDGDDTGDTGDTGGGLFRPGQNFKGGGGGGGSGGGGGGGLLRPGLTFSGRAPKPTPTPTPTPGTGGTKPTRADDDDPSLIRPGKTFKGERPYSDDDPDPEIVLDKRVKPTPGYYYQIRYGDVFFHLITEAYGIPAGQARLAQARVVNDYPYNQRFHGAAPEGEAGYWKNPGNQRISFMPEFSCTEAIQVTFEGGSGSCFAIIYFPEQ